MCSDAQATTDFYRDELGFPLVKKTVNFDDPHSYHLYFGDETGSPGSLMTFFEWPRAERGRLGRGTLESIGLVTPAVTEETRGRRTPTACGCGSTRVSGRALHDVVAIGNPDLYAGLRRRGRRRSRSRAPADETALVGAGVTHHIAWRTADDDEQAAWRERLCELGLRPTAQQERKYFRSIYFRMPDGILLEIATDGPGFLVDEAPTRLGQTLALPPWLEPERETLERELAADHLTQRVRGEPALPRLLACAGEDLNLHAPRGTRPSTLRVYQFRHQRVDAPLYSRAAGGVAASRGRRAADKYTLWRMFRRVIGALASTSMEALRDPSSITPRQKQVIQLIAAGRSNEEVGRALGISPRTAKAHCDTLRLKLGVRKRRQIPLAYRL